MIFSPRQRDPVNGRLDRVEPSSNQVIICARKKVQLAQELLTSAENPTLEKIGPFLIPENYTNPDP